MRIKSLLRQALLPCFASLLLVSCLQPKPEEKGVEYNSYTEQITENHLLIRKEIQNVLDSANNFTDTPSFGEKIMPLVLLLEEHRANGGSVPANRQDSLLYGAAERLTGQYSEIINNDLKELFRLYSSELSDSTAIKAEEIKNKIAEKDREAVDFFKKYMGSDISIPLIE